MTGLAGLQVPSRLPGMVICPGMVRHQSSRVTSRTLGRSENSVIRPYVTQLDVTELSPVRLKLKIGRPEPGVAFLAVFPVMTAETPLFIVERLDRMNFEPVAPMAFRNVVTTIILRRKLRVDTASGVAVKALCLIMAPQLFGLFCAESL